ncbi:MAG: glutamine synthetase III [Oscillospiraceae bacterium]|nr:glutamine synthetase III [Oscillospiraceae bacterium]
MKNVPELFSSMVFNDTVMREKLPKDVYNSLHKTIADGSELEIAIANVVANAMKDWAIEKGATHYTHWFQPMTGITAEKHDSFISPVGDCSIIMDFSGKQLIRGEPDASSFPSGGLRATFEARGYTAWDPTSYAFIKDDSLCIPTAFCSYSGEVLDKKTPLLRSIKVISEQAVRILKLFGHTDVENVIPTVGAEQEYFLIDKELFGKRKDLKLTGRTLFGAKPPKGQELDDHYFGVIKPRVIEFMKDLNEELWKLGIYAKTQHNETAPAQHELAPIFTKVNVATDHNQLIMEMMKRVADRHGLACLLHEKPFAYVNGSGKHNNWSLVTNTGINLFDPGKIPPQENKLFLLFLCAVVKAVDEYQDLLRLSVATAGNDHRLGKHEAPPAILSIYLGDEIKSIFDSIRKATSYDPKIAGQMDSGVNVLPSFQKDTTDRNRTSPFAFTGNKFEFRMVGSSLSISEPNIVLNTIVAESLCQFADILENAIDFDNAVTALMKETITKHKRIIFNGNNYAKEWVIEAENRGLLNLKTAVDALVYYKSEKNINLFLKHKILNLAEINARFDIMLENYHKMVNIEALTMIEMVNRDIIPAVYNYLNDLSESVTKMKSIGVDNHAGIAIINKISDTVDILYEKTKQLEVSHEIMQEVRCLADELETIVGNDYWPFPTYADLLFSV